MDCCAQGLMKMLGGSDLGLSMPKKYTYFGLATPVGLPSMLCLEVSGKPYEGKSVGFEEWPALKPTTPNGVLPYADMPDGSVLAESGAIGRVIAGAAGLLGTGKDFGTSEMLVGMNTDLNKKVMAIAPTAMTIKDFDGSKKAAFADGKPGVLDFLQKYPKFLLPSGDRFTAGGLTFGEIHLFACLYCYAKGPLPEVAKGELSAFYDRMAAVPGIKKVIEGTSKFGELAPYLLPIP
mmetsp:Transcript_52225/g.93686  ORF Transcript_52225/g.93686 Transcript_52225/m.93686 type:complete len:235 (-) Transcript_52225:168-872(-)|eukprot:CAMPEP_0197619900 /NCGR_PEP_ID=MMETSP1338-20131121/857_1 /TAXON_ID=43686 ORGANISM="Pelagodinium beii, Strain RCC1491" /NCGR_SAMPLE_ID=MMETSP1338 /ASSEMBLY_ACC=CAM_ASM_000754 /LENGTH=234 /DNA_ID=CAMNT_0043188953 /DNA_START=64 /DNA_END=768 /DNA_ORIENTATION=-